MLTSRIDGTQATLTGLLAEEAGFKVSNIDGIEEVTVAKAGADGHCNSATDTDLPG